PLAPAAAATASPGRATRLAGARVATAAPGATAATIADVHAVQRRRFGGLRWGADFVGTLCAAGLTAIVLGILDATDVKFGLRRVTTPTQPDLIGTNGA